MHLTKHSWTLLRTLGAVLEVLDRLVDPFGVVLLSMNLYALSLDVVVALPSQVGQNQGQELPGWSSMQDAEYELRRMPHLRSSQNSTSRHLGE